MPHWKSMVETDYLFAFALEGKDRVVTIQSVVAGVLTANGGKKSKKPICKFLEFDKPLALNATNCKSIASMYGNDTDGWAGKRVTLYPTQTQMGGETVDCIRVRGGLPQVNPLGDPNDFPAFTEDVEFFEGVMSRLAAIRTGLETCDSYQKASALREQLGSKAKPLEAELTRDLQRARTERLLSLDDTKAAGKEWQSLDRQVAKKEKDFPPDVTDSFTDPAEEFPR